MIVRKRHVGSYGLCAREDRVLLIRKARGPYTDLLDLPGGGLQHGESPGSAVEREFIEETGLAVSAIRWLSPFSHVARYTNSCGQDEELHHIGFIWRVDLTDAAPPKPGPDGQDSLGSAWYPLATLDDNDISPVVRVALAAWANCTVI